MKAPILSLPNLNRPFELVINAEEGVTYGVLTQEWCGTRKPVAYLSKLLDPMANMSASSSCHGSANGRRPLINIWWQDKSIHST